MPSSISNSEIITQKQLKPHNWQRAWWMSLLIFLVMFASIELLLRDAGYRPSVVDDFDLWVHAKDVIESHDADCVVLTGASRIQVGFHTESFRKRYPQKNIAQLAVSGSSPLATLKNLARDETFKGTVLCAVGIHSLRKEGMQDQQAYIDYYLRRAGPNTRFNRLVSIPVQNYFTIVNPRTKLLNIAKDLVNSKKFPPVGYVITQPDRSQFADYSMRTKKPLRGTCLKFILLRVEQNEVPASA